MARRQRTESTGATKKGKFPVLSSGQITNPKEEYLAIIISIGTTIDDENDPAPETIPEQQEQQQGNG